MSKIPQSKLDRIYKMTIEGCSAKEIQDELGISPTTIARHRKKMNIDYHRNNKINQNI